VTKESSKKEGMDMCSRALLTGLTDVFPVAHPPEQGCESTDKR
jgi:hypothetical protein